MYWSDLSALLSHYRPPEFRTWVCFFLSAMRCRKEWGLFKENNNTFVPTFLLTVCSRKSCGNVWTGIWRLVERQVSSATKTGLGTSTEGHRVPLLDLNFLTHAGAVLILMMEGLELCWPALYRTDFCDDTKTIGYSNLLYKHQWNIRWAFTRRLDIFTCENSMLLHIW